MSNHTPGPWRFDEEAGAVFSCDELIADINQKFGEEEPNARLIASSPDLLEALEGLLSYTLACEGLLNATEAGQCHIARQAIAKAKGDA